MIDKREGYRAEIRRLQHRNRRRQLRKDIINVSILNAFGDVQEKLEQLLAEGRLEELRNTIAVLWKDVE